MDGEMSTEATRTSLAERLRAIAVSLQMEPGGDATTAKFVFDLRAAAGAIDDLDKLVQLTTHFAEGAERRGLTELGTPFEPVEKLAREIRERLDAANPEPVVV